MTQSALLDALHEFCLQQGLNRTYWIAYSGGLDSHVLLSLCVQLRSILPIPFRVIHINHSVSPYAATWAIHCAEICKKYEIDYVERSIQIDLNAGDSFEEVARERRYAIFAEHLNEGDVLLTAHHQDDQAETVLLQLCRGAGPKGLAAMPLIKPFAKGVHARPLLSFPRARLEAYAHSHQLKWIEDESNSNTKLTRNFIRHEVMPLLKSRWPTVTNVMARSASHCSESQVLLEEFAVEEYEIIKGSCENTISVQKLVALDAAKQKWMLRTWIEQLGYPLPDTKKLDAIRHDVLMAKWDRLPFISWENTELRRYRDDLYLMPAMPKHDAMQTFVWDLTTPLYLPQVGMLYAEETKGSGLSSNLLSISVTFRRGGEKIFLSGRGHRTLKNLFQEWNILPWERAYIPLIMLKEKVIGVVGYFTDARYAAKQGETGYELVLKRLR